MYKSFEIIDNFIRDIYECDFLKETLDSKINQIEEIMIAHKTVQRIIDENRPPFSKEFVENVFPILELAVQWDYLKKSKKISDQFMQKCKKRMSSSGSNFRGAMFELDMATRCLLSNWEVDFPEDYTKKGKQIDLIIKGSNGERIALECTSKRGTDIVDIKKINETIQSKNEKFEPKYLKLCDIQFAQKIVILDLTRHYYKLPQILADVSKIRCCDNIDGVALTWREDIIENENHSVRIKYKCLGSIPDKYFSTTWAAEFHKGPVFFLRKYVEPEPKHGTWSPEEHAKFLR